MESYETDYEDSNDKDLLLIQNFRNKKLNKSTSTISILSNFTCLHLILLLLLGSTIFSISFLTTTYFYEEYSTYSSIFHQFSKSRDSEVIPLPTNLNLTNNDGTITFNSSIFTALLPSRHLRLTTSVSPFSSECLDVWLSEGIICPALEGRWSGKDTLKDLDIVWTWGNSSSGLLLEWREQLMGKSQKLPSSRADLALARLHSSPGIWKRAITIVRTKLLPPKASQFRDHDELRYSMRSILSSFPPSTLRVLHIIVGDSLAISPPLLESYNSNQNLNSDQLRLAQIPHYLNLSTIEFSGLNKIPTTYDRIVTLNGLGEEVVEEIRHPILRLHSHSEIFKTAAYGAELIIEGEERNEKLIWENDEKVAKEWRESVLPSFNSLAIESQIPNIDDLGENVLYLNDDFFILQPLSITDVVSPLTGPVIRLQRDLSVGATDPRFEDTADNAQGEWKGLGFANYLLNERFGVRSRPYVVHQAKSVSTALLQEAQEAFLDEFTTTAASRFRGQSLEIQTSFLRIHYIIEKHREALLWSFFLAKSDSDQDGFYSNLERSNLLSNLGWDNKSPSIQVQTPSRSTFSILKQAEINTGLPSSLQTKLEFSSMDGYAHFYADKNLNIANSAWSSFTDSPLDGSLPLVDDSIPECTILIQECFGIEFLSEGLAEGVEEDRMLNVQKIFKRISFAFPRCGDCIIIELIRQSGKQGLEAFLPPLTSPLDLMSDHSPPRVEVIGLDSTSYLNANFTLPPLDLSPKSKSKSTLSIPSLRRRTLSLIHRYSYTIASTPSEFIPVQSSASLENKLHRIDTFHPTFVALNDETATFSAIEFLEQVDKVMKTWFMRHWNKPSMFEEKVQVQ